MVIPFEQKQKTKILRCVEIEEKNYNQIHCDTGLDITTVRGRISEIRSKGHVVKSGENFKITEQGTKYLEENGVRIEVQ